MAKRHTILILIALLLALPLTAPAAKHYTFVHYDTGNGLPQNMITSLAQDQTGFIWIGTKNGLSRFDGSSFQTYHSGMGSHGPGNSYINGLCATADGKLWIATAQGVYIYDPKSDLFSRFGLKSDLGTAVKSCSDIYEHNGFIYILTHNDGLFRYDIRTQQMRQFPFDGMPSVMCLAFSGRTILLGFYQGGLYYSADGLRSLHPYVDSQGRELFKNESVSDILPMGSGKLYVGSDVSGLSEVNLRRRSVKPLLPKWDLKGNYVHDLQLRGNEIWAATENGIYVYDMHTGQSQHYVYEPSNPYSIPDDAIQCLYADKEEGIWAGSYFGGVISAPKQATLIEKFFPRADQSGSMHGRHVRNLIEDGNRQIWVATEDGGLNRYDMDTGTFSHLPASDAFPNIHGLCIVGSSLWVGTFTKGVRILDLKTGRVTKSYTHSGSSLIDDDIFCIHKGRDGKVYLGTLAGPCVYSASDNSFRRIEGLPAHIVNDILEDRSGNLWIAYDGYGLYCRKGQKWLRYTSAGNSHFIADDYVIALFQSGDGTLWACTEGGGVNRYNKAKDRFEPVSVQKGKPYLTVLQIQEDSEGQLWMSTLSGLLCYDPKSGNSSLYSKANGLLDNNFNYSSSLYASDGRIYMGSASGMIAFSPEAFREAGSLPSIVATELLVNNKKVYSGEEGSLLKENIVFQRELVLKHQDNSFSIRFSVLSFSNMRSGAMEYRLEGFDEKWQPIVGDNYAKYTYLPTGKYRLQVRSIGSDGKPLAKPYELSVVVRPPLYLTWWAWTIYILLLSAIIWAAYAYMQQRTRIRQRLAQGRFEHEKEQELYQSKINFFTNVAHEIRTPLTLIKGPLEDIVKRKHDRDEAEDLEIMRQNVDRLLRLTKQLLDFRKAERDNMRMNLVHTNINKLLESVYVRFTPLMQQKHIDHSMQLPSQTVYTNVDVEGFTKIISNLLNNAVKYCDHVVRLSMEAAGEQFFVTVTNDGKIIHKEARERIFTPFFRVSDNGTTTEGTGIGLALARSLAELQGGTLGMDNDEHMNVFRLSLPLSQKATLDIEEPEPVDEDEMLEEKEGTPCILIVEDNAEMRSYEQRMLQRNYNVLTAADGEEALKLLEGKAVDLIVSDALMEPMDGFELCKRIKDNINSSHIPFIMLTALTLDSAKIKGMESGADSYIEKPFSMDYLLSVIDNLLRQRQSLKQTFAKSPFVDNNDMTNSKADEEFMARLSKVMDENIKNSDFDINQFAAEMAMSRTGLNRKLKGTFNLTPNNYIKLERLKRAAKLLKAGNKSISEVSYAVGFSTPSYFSQCFTKQFGLLPKEFMEQANSDTLSGKKSNPER